MELFGISLFDAGLGFVGGAIMSLLAPVVWAKVQKRVSAAITWFKNLRGKK